MDELELLRATLVPLFRPRSVAVVGASRDPRSIGHAIVRNLVQAGFTGPIYPVNPLARAVRGVPCHASLDAVPGAVDLAVIVVPAPAVLDAIEACGRKGVGAAVIISAGFKESGPEGAAREEALRAAAVRHGIRLVGPNCMGVISTDPEVCLDASFAAVAPAPGNVAFASQSGALGEAILSRSRELDLGLSAFVSLGNKADVGPDDLLDWWEHDPRTRVVLLYLESLGDPRRFAAAARRVARAGKPILVVKSGRTEAGARASTSHTGALAGVDEATTMLLEQAGVLRVTRVEGLFNLARAFSSHQPLPRGPRVAIVTNAGGPGIMAADAATAYGLTVAPLAPETLAALRALLPPAAGFNNPVDTIATASGATFGAALCAVLRDPGVDALLPIYVGPSVVDVRAVATEIVDAVRRADAREKPVLGCFMGGRVAEAREVMARAGIPAYDFPEDAAQALAAMARFQAWRARDGQATRSPSPELDDAWRARVAGAAAALPAGWIGTEAALRLLAAAGLNVAPHAFEADPAALARASSSLGGWPVVAKLEHPDLLHKSDVGGVRLHLADEAAVLAAAEDLLARGRRAGLDPARARLLVMRQVGPGRELLLGARTDPAVGPVVVVGLGGIHAEALRDVSLRVPPLTARDADDMLSALRGARLLDGHRGEPAVDRPAVRDAILRLAALAEAVPRLAELDINPLLALPEGRGAVVVDARIRLDA